MHAIFILLYLCCVCGVEICVCLIFVNSFHKNSLVQQSRMMKVDNWARDRQKAESRIMNLWSEAGKKYVV